MTVLRVFGVDDVCVVVVGGFVAGVLDGVLVMFEMLLLLLSWFVVTLMWQFVLLLIECEVCSWVGGESVCVGGRMG